MMDVIESLKALEGKRVVMTDVDPGAPSDTTEGKILSVDRLSVLVAFDGEDDAEFSTSEFRLVEGELAWWWNEGDGRTVFSAAE